MYRKFETSEMSIKKIKHNTQVGGKINRPGQLAPHPCNKGKWNLTTKKTAQFDLNYDYKWINFMYRYLKQVKWAWKNLTLISHVGGKINRPGQLAPHPCNKG